MCVSKKDHETCNCTGKNHAFHHQNIAYRNQRMLRISRGCITSELVLKIIKVTCKHKQSNYISTSQEYFRKSIDRGIAHAVLLRMVTVN